MSDNIKETIGLRIRALRISRGISPVQVAGSIGGTINRLTRIENGKSELSAVELIAVAKSLGVTTSQLIGEEPVDGGASA